MMSANNAGGKAGTGVFFPIALQESLSSTTGSQAPAPPSTPDTSHCLPVQGSAHAYGGNFQHATSEGCTDKHSNHGDRTNVNLGGAFCGDATDMVNALSYRPCTSPGTSGYARQHPTPHGRHDSENANRNHHRPPYGRFSSDFPRTQCTATVQSRLVQQAVLPSRVATWTRNTICSSLSAPSSPSIGAAAGYGGMDKLSCQPDVFGPNTDCLNLHALMPAQARATALAAANSQNILLAQHARQQQECRWSASQAEHAVYLPCAPSPLGSVAEGFLPLSTTADSCSSTPFISQHLPTNSSSGSWLLPQLAAVPAATTLPDIGCRRRASFGPLTSCTGLPRDTLDSRTYSVPLPDARHPQQPSSEVCATLLAAALALECDQSVTTEASRDDALTAEVDAALHQLLVMHSQMASKKAQVAAAAPTAGAAPSAVFPAALSPPPAAAGAGCMSPACALAPQLYLQGLSVPCVPNSLLHNTAGISNGLHIQSMGAGVCVPKACQPMFLSDAAPVAYCDQRPLNIDAAFAGLMIEEPVGGAYGAGVPPYNISVDGPLQREMTLADVLANAAGQPPARMPVPAISPADELQLLVREQLAAASAATELGIPGMPASAFEMTVPIAFLH